MRGCSDFHFILLGDLEVDVEICSFSDLGITVAINNEYTGLIYGNQVYANYHEGEKLKAYIKCVREDGRIDVSLQPKKGDHIFSTADKLLKYLEDAGGKSRFNDKSSPEDIRKNCDLFISPPIDQIKEWDWKGFKGKY